MTEDSIETLNVVVILSVGRELTEAEVVSIRKLKDVHLVTTTVGQIEVTIPNKKASSLEIDLIKKKINRAIELAPYRETTDDEANEIWESVGQWFDDAPMTGSFNDCKAITKKSVAEYLANQKGLTLFDLK